MSPNSPARRTGDLPVVGWREWVRFPDLHGLVIKAKVDTGARTSSLHAFDLELIERDGADWVDFEIHPLQRNARRAVRVALPVVDHRQIRSSNGKTELRPVVRVVADLDGRPWPIELTLTRRDAMGFRMLLGREALRGRVLVDTSRSYLTGGRPKRRRRKKERT